MLKISFGALSIAGVLALGFAGFRGAKSELTHIEWFNDMAHQPKAQPQHRSDMFADTRSARQPVPGTVPIGFNLEGRYFQTEGNNLVDGHGGFTNSPDYQFTGRKGDVYGDGIPKVFAERGRTLLERGQQRFNINCAICHGKSGKGTGVLKSFGMVTIADLTAENFRNQPDGQIFNTITHGKNTMGAYGPVITVEDRWAIVSYVRVLQKIGEGKLAAPPPPPPAPAPGTPAPAGAPAPAGTPAPAGSPAPAGAAQPKPAEAKP
jgi:hypothetical protein